LGTVSPSDRRRNSASLGSLYFEENGDARYIAIDGKKMRASKDGEGGGGACAFGVLRRLADDAFTRILTRQGLENTLHAEALGVARLESKIVTGDAICCQKSITAKIVEDGGDYTRGHADHALKRLRCPQRTPLPWRLTERQNRRTPAPAQGHGRTLLRKSAAPV
jgi:hypothetical protein